MQAQTGIELKPTQFRVLLKENDFVYRCPKHDLTNRRMPSLDRLPETDCHSRATTMVSSGFRLCQQAFPNKEAFVFFLHKQNC
jgi:hypothetical protein